MASKGVKVKKSTKRKDSESSENFDAIKSKKPKLVSDKKHKNIQNQKPGEQHGKPKFSKPKSFGDKEKSVTLSKKERRVQAKELTEARKKRRKPHYTLQQELASLWEKMRRRDIGKDDRSKLISEALQKMKGKIPEIAGSHVSSCVLQTCVKYCTQAEKEAVFKELQPHFLNLASNTYAVHLLKKMLDGASMHQLTACIASLRGHVAPLLRHMVGSVVVEHAYHLGTAAQKQELLGELYSTELQLFKGSTLTTEKRSTATMAAADGESSLTGQKKNKRGHKRKWQEEIERMDSLPWSSSISIGEDDDEKSFSTLFAGSTQLDGGFLSLEEIDEANYNLVAFPTTESGKTEKRLKSKKQSRENSDGYKKTVDEIIEGEQDNEENKVGGEEDGDEMKSEDELDSSKIKEQKNKKKKKKTQKNVKEAEKEQDSFAVSCDEDNKTEELNGLEEIPPEFSAWNLMRLHPLLMKSIYHLGFKEPTEIQRACFSVAAFQGMDVIGAAETGCGKTLAFGLPILQRLLDEREKVGKLFALKGDEAQKYSADGYLRALIVTPTRELALQVTDHLKKAAENFSVMVVPIVGGMSSAKQERLLKGKPEIVVGTPGRLWELMSAGEKHLVELHCLSFFVLDEADRMVESGHFQELQSIIDLLPVTDRPNEGKLPTAQSSDMVSDAPKKKRQTFVFSATIALSSDFRKKLKRSSSKSKQSSCGEVNSIEVLSERAGMRDNVAIIDLTTASILAPKIEESFIRCEEEEKDAYLYYILSVHGQGRTIVFCTSVAALRHICALLKILGIDVCKLYSDMKQRARLKAIDRFRASENGILVATDVVARGIDIKNVRTIIHYQLPHSAEVYVHRSGRTARAFADGCSIALIAPNDTSKFYTLCKSFSKESVKVFPLDSSYMPAVRKRLSLARQIDQIERKCSREKVDKTWLEKHAELMELELDEDESEEERVDSVRQRKATSAQLKKLQEDLSSLLSRRMQPKKFSGRYLAGRGMSPLLQNQLAELTNQKQPQMPSGGDKKRRKLVVVAQNCIEPLQALRAAGNEMMNMKGQSADKRRDIATLRKKKKEEKIGRRDQRRDQKKKRELMAS